MNISSTRTEFQIKGYHSGFFAACRISKFYKLGYIKGFSRSLSLNGKHWCLTGNMIQIQWIYIRIIHHARLKLSFLSIDIDFLEIRKNVWRKQHETGNSKNSFLSFSLKQHKSFILLQTSTCDTYYQEKLISKYQLSILAQALCIGVLLIYGIPGLAFWGKPFVREESRFCMFPISK